MTVGSYNAGPAGAAPDFAEAHDRLLADNRIQFDLPRSAPAPPPSSEPIQYVPPPTTTPAPAPPVWSDPSAPLSPISEPVASPIADQVAAGASPALQILLWAGGAVLVLLILYWVVARLRDRRRAAAAGGRETERENDWRPEAAPALRLLGEADALAADGRYGEAARLVLFRSIEDIEARRPRLLRPALTSRDIAGLAGLPGGPRAAFARIAMTVERSLFARAELADDDWRDCRAAYEEFAFAESWGG
jgi:hypothetical protein